MIQIGLLREKQQVKEIDKIIQDKYRSNISTLNGTKKNEVNHLDSE